MLSRFNSFVPFVICAVVFSQYLVSHSQWPNIKTSRRVKTIVNNSTAHTNSHIFL